MSDKIQIRIRYKPGRYPFRFYAVLSGFYPISHLNLKNISGSYPVLILAVATRKSFF